jgi:hypothetical protein
MGTQMFRQRVIVGAPPWRTRMADAPVRHVEAARLGVGPRAQHVVDFWYEHDDARAEVERTFVVVGTGHEVPAGARYCGTTARTDDGLVWHLFELPDGEATG